MKLKKRYKIALENLNNAVNNYESLPDSKREDKRFWETRIQYWSDICDECEANGASLTADGVLNAFSTLGMFIVATVLHEAGHPLVTRDFHWKAISFPRMESKKKGGKKTKK